MSETPDFEQIACKIIDLTCREPTIPQRVPTWDDVTRRIAEQLRQVWNARGEAEQALIEKWRPMAVCNCSVHCDCDSSGYEACIADLQALLDR